MDELLGCTTGQLRYIRPDTAHAIGRMAELALLYSIISAFTAGPKSYSVMTAGGQGAAGAWATPQHSRGQQDRLLDYWLARTVDTATESASAAGPFMDYWPAGRSGRLV